MNSFGDPKLLWDPSRLLAVSKRRNIDVEIEYLLDLWSKEFKVCDIKSRHHFYKAIPFTYHGVLLENRYFSLVWSTVAVS